MLQRANWDEIRQMRDRFVGALGQEGVLVLPEGNGFTVSYADGSQVTWTPTITADAAVPEPQGQSDAG